MMVFSFSTQFVSSFSVLFISTVRCSIPHPNRLPSHPISIHPSTYGLRCNIRLDGIIVVERLACNCIDTALVENAVEELQSHDGEDDDEEHDEQHDVEEGDHRHDDRVDDNL